VLVGLLTLVGLATGRIIGNDFLVWDDPATIVFNPAFNPPALSKLAIFWNPKTVLYSLWVPVTYTAWGLIAQLAYLNVPDEFGVHLNATVFHGASVLVHAVNTLLVFVLIRRLMRMGDVRTSLDFPAFVGATLFGVHPLQIEPVAWASGLKDLLWVFFSLASTLSYLQWLGPERTAARQRWGGGWWWASIVLFALGTLSKPTAVVAPVLIAVIQLVIRRDDWRTVVRGLWPFMLWALPALYWSGRAQPGVDVDNFPDYLRPLVAMDALAFYLYKLVWPKSLAFDYGRHPVFALSQGWLWWTWVFPAALGLLLAWRIKKTGGIFGRWRVPLAGVLWALIAVGPVLGLRAFHYQFYTTVADHYMYGAMIGLGLVAAWAIARWRASGKATSLSVTACAVVLGALVVRSALACAMWQNSLTLFTTGLEVNPRSFAALNTLAALMMDDPRIKNDKSRMLDVLHMLDEAISLRPEYPQSYDTRANALIILAGLDKQAGDPASAQRAINEAVRMSDKYWDANKKLPRGMRGSMTRGHVMFAKLYVARRDYAKALEHYLAAEDEMNYWNETDPAQRKFLQNAIVETRRAMQATPPAGTTRPTSEPTTVPAN
jgi:hypothetical protein